MTDTNITTDILNYIRTRYLESPDFNGVAVSALVSKFGITEGELKKVISTLVTKQRICLVFGDIHPNPHIKAFEDEPIEKQLEKIDTLFLNACAYPAKESMSAIISSNDYIGKPYDYELALGSGQLEYKAFDLSVLESYRNDPRYLYRNSDIGGQICISDDYFLSPDMAEHDQILLQTFGFCYDEKRNRAVAVYLRYLKDLSPEHQQIWKLKELSKNYYLHPDYYRTSLVGQFPEGFSLADAFLAELKIINMMCEAMNKPPLFNETFEGKKPREFGFLVRPTLSELHSFVLILDKMMSDNINKKFFKDDFTLEHEEVRKDGKIIISQKSTISLLEEWSTELFKTQDREAIDEMISAFREVRKARQKPAHAVNEDEFDQKYFHEQRELFKKAYNGIRIIRLILANHPDVITANIKINAALYEGRIWTF